MVSIVKTQLIFILITGVLGSYGSQALQAASPASETVEQLFQVALSQNAELQYYEQEIAIARGQRRQAGLWKNPEIDAEYGKRRVRDGEGILQGDGFTRGISIRQTFEFPGKASLRKAVADQDIEIARLGLEQFKASLRGKIHLLALRYQIALENAAASEEIHQRSHDLIGILKKRPLAGTAALIELRLIESSLMDLQKKSAQFALEKEELRLEINSLLGRPHSTPLRLHQTMEPPGKIADLNGLVLTALGGNLLLKIRTQEIQKAARMTSGARLEAAPDFTLGPFYSEDKAGDDEINAGVSLSVPLPLWNQNQGNIAAAQGRQRQADILLVEARRKVEEQVARRHRAFLLARDLLEKTLETGSDEFKDTADLADRQYRTGAIGIQLFLDMQRAYFESLQIRQQAKIDAWKNLLDLRLLCGGELPGESEGNKK